MVRELERKHQSATQFPETAPAANPVFFRTYSRRIQAGLRETWPQVCDRTIQGLVELGKLTSTEADIIVRMQRGLKSLASGRWLWVGGTDWIAKPSNFSGGYNCTSTNLEDWRAFGLMMDLAMMGAGTGAILEPKYISQLPPIRNPLNITMQGEIGSTPQDLRREETEVKIEGNTVTIYVGDSRQGWVKSYQTLLELAASEEFSGEVQVLVNLSDVRQAGETLKGFGGVANPVKLPGLYQRCASILNKAVGRQLNSVECCLLIDEAAVTIVAGNIRRCLPEDALVHTAKGLVPIRDVQVGDLVQTPLGFRRVINKFDQGFQDVYEIETNATYPRATLNHRQAVLGDAQGGIIWKYVNSLQAGDRLMHSTQILPGTVTQLPEDFTSTRPSQSRTAKKFQIPALTPEVAWLIGFTHGDGYVALGRNKHNKPYGRVEWSMNSEYAELTAKIQDKIDAALSLFGLSASHGITKGENTAKSICSSIRLAEYFHKYIKQPNVPLQVPSFILQGSIDIRAAYLAGLMDSDGGVNNRPPHLITTVYRNFVRQVGVVLSSLGIAGRISITVPQKAGWQAKYNLKLPALKSRYNNLIAPHSLKGEIREGLKMYGFTVPGAIMRSAYTYSEMREMGFQGSRTVDANYERYIAESDISLDIPVTFKGLGSYDHIQTYDIEVESAHCFYCDGYLTHNSAGIRQGISDDNLFADAKANLWQQDAEGNWRIDPERDALRMANHTRVFHQKPTLEECINAVRKQYYSGEGAIQWAGEALVRANNDLFSSSGLKVEFLQAYEQGKAKEWIQKRYPNMDAQELEHRLGRYGLNPCITGDTWIHTEQGARQVKDLIGTQQSVYVDGELFSTTKDGFFFTGVKPIFKVVTQEGYELRLTGNHQLLKVTAQTQKKQYTEWVETQNLNPGDYIMVHNHRNLLPWDGVGSFDEGWLLGSFLGDGCFSANQSNYSYQAKLRYWGDTQVEMKEYALALVNNLPQSPCYSQNLQGCYNSNNKYYEVSSANLAKLANSFGLYQHLKVITPEVEQASYEFYRGFLRGLFDADGSVQGTQQKGVSVRLAQSNLETLKIVQRMLARLGIISTIYQESRSEGYRCLPDSNRELAPYFCKTQHELVISNDNLYVFQEIVGFQEPKKAQQVQELLSRYKRKPNRERFTVKIKEIIPDGVEEVFDCTVPAVSRFDANGVVAHNCGEIIGSNFHCVSGDTLMITRDGMHKIKDLIGCEVEIWNGERWSKVTPLKTGNNRKLYRVRFGDGTYLDATEYHRFFVKDRFNKNYKEVQTKDLMDVSKYAIHTQPFTIEYTDGIGIDPSYAYTLGVAVGDGTTDQKNNAKIRLYNQKAALAVVGNKSPAREYDYLPAFTDVTEIGFSGELLKSLKTNPEAINLIASWNRQAILHFIAGLADTDGSNTHSNGIRVYISDYERAYRIQLLLTKCGIRSSLNLCAHKGAVTNLGVRSRDLYYLQITDCGEIPCQRLDISKGQSPKYKGKWQIVNSVEELPGLHDTYCFNEPEHHKGVFGNTLTGNCNLAEIHLNQIDPQNDQEQEEAFTAGALSVAVLLNHKFVEPRYQYSRELDPIVGVSFTGLFDFFVRAFGVDWLRWWEQGRPETPEGLTFKHKEQEYLSRWQDIVHRVVWDYCNRHNIKPPNRCTTVQPSGTKSLLTGASPGWHPPKAQRFIRRITFRKNDPVALACLEYGYNIVPSQADKDDNGNLLHDPFDPRCTEWLVEIPVAVPWADLPGADTIDISKFSALAQMDFYMQVQKFYTAHNTSATIELRENEVESLGTRIYEAIRDDEGYISAALLARFDDHQTFPRLPFEPISKQQYEELMQEVEKRRQTDDFHTALSHYDTGELLEAGPAGCDSDKCMMPEETPN